MGTPRRPITRDGKPCGTPGAVYGSTLAGNLITLRIKLPVYLRLSARRETEMFAAIHDRLLMAIEDVYRDNWNQFAGQTIDGTGPLPERYDDLFTKWLAGTSALPRPNGDTP